MFLLSLNFFLCELKELRVQNTTFLAVYLQQLGKKVVMHLEIADKQVVCDLFLSTRACLSVERLLGAFA